MSSAHRLAVTRIVVCGTLILASITENASALSWLPNSMRDKLGIIAFIPRNFSRDPVIWTLVDILVPLALCVALLGYRTRLALLVGASAYLIEGGLLRAFSKFYHPGLVPMQMAFLLALTPCGDVLSLDARWRNIQRKPDAVYRWALLAVWAPLAMTYLMAGLNKLRYTGLEWFAADNMRGYVAQNQFRVPPPGLDMTRWVSVLPDVFWTGMALFSAFTELGYITVLWSRRARWVFPLCAAAMHVGIWAVLGAQFPDLIIIQLAVFPVEQVWSYATRRLRWRSSSLSPQSG